MRVGACSPRTRVAGAPSSRILPVVHDRHPVAERLGLVHVVGGQHDGAAGVVDLRAAGPTGCAGPAGRGRPSARPGTPVPGRAPGRRRSTAAASGRRRASRCWVSACSVSPTVSSISSARLHADAVQRRERADLLARGQPLEEGRRLQLDADARQQPVVARPRRLAEHADGPAVGLTQALDDLQGGGLAGAVRAEDAEELALLRPRT